MKRSLKVTWGVLKTSRYVILGATVLYAGTALFLGKMEPTEAIQVVLTALGF